MWVLGIPSLLLIVLYLVLLVTPIRLPFTGGAVRAFVQSFIPPTSTIEMGDMALALERGIWPVIRFDPVVLSDSKSGAHIAMEALEIGFSPARALFGQPGATVTVVGPHIQMVQDLYGPRLTRFEMVEDPNGGPPVVRVLEGDDAFPSVEISPEGIALEGENATALRSDNDWLIYNLEASEMGIAELVEQAAQGRFSRLVVRDGRIDMSDAVYGLFRQFHDVSLEIGPSADRRETTGTFSALIGGRQVVGTIDRTIDDDGVRRLQADVTNIDFAAFLPFIDDEDSMAAMRGAGAISIDVTFTAEDAKLIGGDFKVDLTGVDLRLAHDYFPVASSILNITWEPETGQFHLDEGAIQIGDSSARVAGVFALGLDPSFGPTIGMSIKAREVYLRPGDLGPPDSPFDSVEFSGWSAPLYGALGIDRLVASKPDAVVETRGRIDLLTNGLGVDMTVAGTGVTADDFKRLWPYLMGEESRDWFVANVPQGRVKTARMRFDFPVGTLALDGEERPLPPDAMNIEVVAEGLAIKPTESMPPIVITGDTRLTYNGAGFSVAGGGGAVDTAGGTISVVNPALVFDTTNPDESIVEISGDLSAPIPALLALVQDLQPGALDGVDLPVDLESLTGTVDLGLVSTIGLADEEAGTPLKLDYVVNGTVSDFGSSQKIEGRSVGDGQLAFSASQAGYQLGGTASLDGLNVEVSVQGTPQTEPVIQFGGTIAVADIAKMGFDLSDFLSGEVRVVGQPLAGGALQVGIDLAGAGLNIRDLGISKPASAAGSVSAIVRPGEDVTTIEDISLAFGTVRIGGDAQFSATDGLIAADFDTFALSQGDSASVALRPIDGGFDVKITGRQLDLKPVLGRFFSLNQGSGGVAVTQFDQNIALTMKLDRALGHYATTAFNLDLDLLLRGTDLRRATLTAQFDEGNAISITTNPAPNGRTLTMAFNDAGTVLRLLGIYSQLAGGSGSLVMTTDRTLDAEAGQLVMRNFAIVDEANVVQILGNHSDSRSLIASSNRLDFEAGQVDFVRRSDRVEVTNAVLAGETVGGTMRGFIYTDRRQYDLTGTYVPLFGLNNAFQQIPLLGPLLGGRDGEGLVGVTFAIQGALDKPVFRINPLSILVPGAFRELFEYRAKELPPE